MMNVVNHLTRGLVLGKKAVSHHGFCYITSISNKFLAPFPSYL